MGMVWFLPVYRLPRVGLDSRSVCDDRSVQITHLFT
jgi:hypothetical protein